MCNWKATELELVLEWAVELESVLEPVWVQEH
jgi:hypothetical protein